MSNHNATSNSGTETMSNNADYYWRNYTGGVIPTDGVPGGKDINSTVTYIGQAFYSKVGLLIGNIHVGNKSITMTYERSVEQSDIGVKILCGSNLTRFHWKKVDGCSLHVDTVDNHLVIGGYENGKILNVGRAMYQGELIVGKVQGFNASDAKLCIVHNDKEISLSSYQVLIYE